MLLWLLWLGSTTCYFRTVKSAVFGDVCVEICTCDLGLITISANVRLFYLFALHCMCVSTCVQAAGAFLLVVLHCTFTLKPDIDLNHTAVFTSHTVKKILWPGGMIAMGKISLH